MYPFPVPIHFVEYKERVMIERIHNPPRKNRYKSGHGYRVAPIQSVPDEITRCILEFCDPNRYLTLGIVNKKFNYIHKGRYTSTSGHLESDTPLVNDKGECVLPRDLNIEEMARSKHLHGLIPRALDQGLRWDHFCVEEAARVDNKDFFEWLIRSDLFWLPENAYASAAFYGRTGMLEYLRSSGLGYPDGRCRYFAEKNGNLEVLEWVNGVELTEGYALSEGVKNNNLGVVKKNYNSSTHYDWIFQDSVRCGSTMVVEFFLGSGMVPVQRDLKAAIEQNRYEILEILQSWTCLQGSEE